MTPIIQAKQWDGDAEDFQRFVAPCEVKVEYPSKRLFVQYNRGEICVPYKSWLVRDIMADKVMYTEEVIDYVKAKLHGLEYVRIVHCNFFTMVERRVADAYNDDRDLLGNWMVFGYPAHEEGHPIFACNDRLLYLCLALSPSDPQRVEGVELQIKEPKNG